MGSIFSIPWEYNGHMLTNFSMVPIHANLLLTEIRPGDEKLLVEYMQDKEIYDATLRIPFPYTSADATWWVEYNQGLSAKEKILNWAIRDGQGNMMGGIGFNSDFEIGQTHKSEIGYWLGKKHWGKGIMTLALRKVCEIGFGPFHLIRISANVMDFNKGSCRVLEKAGFTLEGTLKSYYRKDEKISDGKLYGRVKSL